LKLKKELNLLDVFCIASGAMISSGIFILPGLAYARAGPAVVISYLLAGLLAITGMLSQAELVSAMPRAGGAYFFTARAMGPAVGTVNGLLIWFSLCLKSAFALVGMAAFTVLIVKLDIHIISLILCLFFIAINMLGIRKASIAQILLVFGLLAILTLYVVFGLRAIDVHHFESFAPEGLWAILSTAGFVFISYGGLLKVASVAEEVRDPGRIVPLGMILSLLVVSILYMFVVMVTTGVLQPGLLNTTLTPISDGAAVFMGTWGRILLDIAAILAFISTANAGIMAASRFPLALSRDGLLPGFLGKINARFKTPHVSIMVTGIFMVLSLFLKLDVLVKAASAVLILTFIFSCLSIIVLRESRLQNYQPSFYSPLYPWLQIVGIIGFGFLLVGVGMEPLIVCAFLMVGGFVLYWFYGRITADREYALLHLIERITAEELTTHLLETELKEIIRERDDITKDRFDRLVERCHVLDLEGGMTVEAFFRRVAETMSGEVPMEQDALFHLLMERERASSTVLTPGLAIPHIIIEGEHVFDILIARCREGIAFSPSAPQVHAVFVLMGTMDERNFHLRALAAIAQIVQDPRFEKRWMSARSKESLRDIVLLGKRLRE